MFFRLVSQLEGYDKRYAEVIREEIVHEASGGKTESLSELYEKYPDEYSKMIDDLKARVAYPERPKRQGCGSNAFSTAKSDYYETERNKHVKRVIAAACEYFAASLIGMERHQRIEYVFGYMRRASNCRDIDKIPISKLERMYNDLRKKNSVGKPGVVFGVN